MGKTPDIAQRFGLRLRELRSRLGISQEVFADKCGLDRTYISGIERGKRNVSLGNLLLLHARLGLGWHFR
jgi:transcriptional regulator with XRE-family HTH domain